MAPFSLFQWLWTFCQCSLCSIVPLSGIVSDCGCDFYSVDTATTEYFVPLLLNLSTQPFFQYFKVDLQKECPFWEEPQHCVIEGCSVCNCEPDEIPAPWRSESNSELNSALDSEASSHPLDVVETSDLENDASWNEGLSENVWIEQDNEKNMVYVNLLKNPERFTGYAGFSARRIWQSIYEENCFEATGDTCLEKRVFYKLVSGLQSSITTHLANEFYYGSVQGWAPNTELFVERVGKYPDRLNNLYFLYLFLLRAVTKAEPILLPIEFNTGNEMQDKMTKELMRMLVSQSVNHTELFAREEIEKDSNDDDSIFILDDDILHRCRNGFQEAKLFQVLSNVASSNQDTLFFEQNMKQSLKSEFQMKFRNISRIMDCVGCEKCRLWGKLQVLGIGTALKILLSSEEDGNKLSIDLQRNEIIALINTLTQVAKSVASVQMWRDREIKQNLFSIAFKAFGILFVFFMFNLYLHRQRQKKIKNN